MNAIQENVSMNLKKLAAAATAALGLGANAAALPDIKIMPKNDSLDGNATADLVWHSNTSSAQALWLMDGNNSSDATVMPPPDPNMGAATIVMKGDFGGDGKADLLWRTPTGGYWLTQMNGLQVASTHEIFAAANNPGGDWTVLQKADFNGDGKTDLLWKQASTDQYAVWLMNGNQITAGNYGYMDRPAAGFEVIALADFNGDNKTDVLWSNAAGDLYVQLFTGITGTQVNNTALAIPSMAGYTLTLVGDFNGDHKADLLWRSPSNEHIIWEMNGAAIGKNTQILAGGTTWQVVFGRDFDNDAITDLVWRDSTNGNTGIWIMNGSQAEAYGTLIYPDSGWTLMYMADFNGDGKTDGVFVNDTDGSVATWLIAGGAAYSFAVVSPPNAGWSVSYLP